MFAPLFDSDFRDVFRPVGRATRTLRFAGNSLAVLLSAPVPAGVLVLTLLVGVGSAPPTQAQSTAETPAADAETPPALRDPYALQVNASEEAAVVAEQLDSLRRRGVPAYRTKVTRQGTTYHRLRVGPFPDQAAAEAFARCRGYADAWLVPATADRTAFGRITSGVATDVVPLRPRPPRYLLGRRNAFAALLMPARGRSSAVRPATMRVYTARRDEPAVIERVTGVRESQRGLEYGRAARVFVKDTSETVAEYGDAIEAFSREYGLSKYLVEDRLALYDGGRVARFTLLGTLALPGGAPTLRGQPGFDYVDAQGRAVRHRGRVGEEQARQVGNAYDRYLRRDDATQGATSRVALFARPAARGENARVCLLFFAE